MSATELQRLDRLNKTTGFFMVIAGGLVIGGMWPSVVRGDLSADLGSLLAVAAMVYGIYLIARRERRQGRRRQARAIRREGRHG